MVGLKPHEWEVAEPPKRLAANISPLARRTLVVNIGSGVRPTFRRFAHW